MNPTEPSLRTTLMGFPRPIYMIFLGTFINRFGTFVLPFLALHMTRLGYSAQQAGLAVAAYGLGHLAASIVGGHLADAIGRRQTIALSMFSTAVSMVLLSLAKSLGGLVGLAALAGLTAEFYKPASSALLADLIPERDRVTAFAAYRFAINAGWALGPATAGIMASHSYLWLFWVDGLTSAVFGVIAWFGLPAALSMPGQAPWHRVVDAVRGLREAARTAFGDRRFVQLVTGTFLVAMVFVQMFSTLGLEVRAHELSERAYGILLAVNGILIVFLEIPLTRVTRRFPARKVMAFGFGMIASSMAQLAVAETFPGYLLAMILFTLGESIGIPVTMAYASLLAPASMRGRYLGVFGLSWGTALTVGPGLGMSLFAFHAPFFWGLCCCAAAGGATILLVDTENRRSIWFRSSPVHEPAEEGALEPGGVSRKPLSNPPSPLGAPEIVRE